MIAACTTDDTPKYFEESLGRVVCMIYETFLNDFSSWLQFYMEQILYGTNLVPRPTPQQLYDVVASLISVYGPYYDTVPCMIAVRTICDIVIHYFGGGRSL